MGCELLTETALYRALTNNQKLSTVVHHEGMLMLSLAERKRRRTWLLSGHAHITAVVLNQLVRHYLLWAKIIVDFYQYPRQQLLFWTMSRDSFPGWFTVMLLIFQYSCGVIGKAYSFIIFVVFMRFPEIEKVRLVPSWWSACSKVIDAIKYRLITLQITASENKIFHKNKLQ